MFFISERKFQEEVEKEADKRIEEFYRRRDMADEIDGFRKRFCQIEQRIDALEKASGKPKDGDADCLAFPTH